MRAAAANPGAAGQAIGMMVGMGVGPAGEPLGRAAAPSAPPPPPPVPARPAYHVAVGGQPTGPFTLEQLREQAAKGGLTRASLVWAAGMAGWQPAAEVAELAAHLRRGAAADPRCRLSRCAPGPGAGCGPRRTSGRRAG